jgi:ubiquinone/menaquinone biosynthesis C-methylase UbiE
LPTLLESENIYKFRFDEDEIRRKNKIWKVLCEDFFQTYIHPEDVVLDIGAGYCEFINNISCSRRIAIDINPDITHFAEPDVEVLNAHSADINVLDDESINVIFVSNFFEHLLSKDFFMLTLSEIYRILKKGGRLLILQPNIRVLGGSYWDFLDHHIPLSDRTVVEALKLTGFKVQEVRSRFLPYTTKSRIPQWPILVRLYLRIPIAHRFLGGQAWIVGLKVENPT